MIEPKENIIKKYYEKEQKKLDEKLDKDIIKYYDSTPMGALINKFIEDANKLVKNEMVKVNRHAELFTSLLCHATYDKGVVEKLHVKYFKSVDALKEKCRLVTDLAKTTTTYEQYRSLLKEFGILDDK